MKTVFILGAGASAEDGVPVIAGFLDAAERIRNRQRDSGGKFKDAFQHVFDAIAELHDTYYRIPLDLNNIEDVFSSIEMAAIVGRLGRLDSGEISNASGSVRALIAKTISDTLRFQYGAGGEIRPPRTYELFIQRLKETETPQRRLKDEIAFITFNYDLALDYALSFNNFDFDYCLPGNSASGLPLLKLHGSLNWFRCEECEKRDGKEHINIKPRAVYYKAFVPNKFKGDICFYLNKDSLFNCDVCDALMTPVLVPPTLSKMGRYKDMESVWRRAVQELSQAQNIIIIGYSLPETDMFFRYLFALSAERRTRVKHLWVFDPDTSVHDRFECILGAGIKGRYKAYSETFCGGIRQIEHLLNEEHGYSI
jgi:NAD-dependent SIR2 family protein deacetylase